MDHARVAKLFETAGHPQTMDTEALAAVRRIRVVLARQNVSLESALAALENQGGALPPPTQHIPYARWQERVAELERELRSAHSELLRMRSATTTVRPTVDAARAKSSESKSPRTRSPGVPPFPWKDKPDIELEAARLFLKGVRNEQLVSLTGANSNQILQRFYNGGPPEGLGAEVRDGGPIDWPEAWLIGRSLFRKAWMPNVLGRLGIKQNASKPPMDLNLQTMPDRIDALREEYRLHIAAPKPSRGRRKAAA